MEKLSYQELSDELKEQARERHPEEYEYGRYTIIDGKYIFMVEFSTDLDGNFSVII